jgi:hypothetical protein
MSAEIDGTLFRQFQPSRSMTRPCHWMEGECHKFEDVSEEFRPGLEDDRGRLPRQVLGLVFKTVPF